MIMRSSSVPDAAIIGEKKDIDEDNDDDDVVTISLIGG